MHKQTLANFLFRIEIAVALNLERQKLWCKDDSKNDWKADISRFGIFLTTVTIVITFVFYPEFQLFKA